MCLQIVETPAPITHQPRVLDGELLDKFNRLIRELRQMGYQVVTIRLRGTPPQPASLQIKRGREQSISPLLDRAQRRCWRVGDDGITRGLAVIDGILVGWEERPCKQA